MRRRLILFVLSAGLLFAIALLAETASLPLTGVVRDQPGEVAHDFTVAARTLRADEPRQSTGTYRAEPTQALNGYQCQHLIGPAPRTDDARKGAATRATVDASGGFNVLPAATREVFKIPGGRECSLRAVRQSGLGNIAPGPSVSVRLDDGEAAYRFGKELVGVPRGGVRHAVQAWGFSVPVVAGLSTNRMLRTAWTRYS